MRDFKQISFLILLLGLIGCGNQKVVTMDNGLIIENIIEGEGTEAKDQSIVMVHYTGWLEDGTKFDSSLNPGRDPFRFTVGARQVILGWDQGLLGMKIGGKRKLTIPPELAYGDRGAGGVIPPGSTLIFEIELLGVE
ncbi:MAG: FKBP-type peptidyl-prolyl cis-trans isomerase [Candidatus Marinimicrobia bacterium]|jgi:FKBP-type peptidyl-prolyl cis-trans isomerase|nr:FKBP-type peptidyl-prolyl cis-trans isomerase [Candidatus Neomarinimicrobiota bacterium]MBT3617621.1 FKBP-type peptidyl-prolyl cis-trans isomerase [Candidatus Neomarinimicrobiota bacterium]MBT3829105.1 FKBP-type peptidyl-prolyl cis-trans isomerase [Candidatus Neomarinimicrobiota bacterium]MBT3997713.1 FKBP-type peptidyl-prolyl cis-trans isomerase [Candidatus Neomarinimicrobiota bacterium]MBT4281400.1 FKBP-type peptidyl-prolyl cis-trans isomerase [Candidatus Neomarinimicrobiota bacterium]